MAAGVSVVHIPYQGISAALPDLVAGRVDIMFANTTGLLPLVRDGRLKVLATASAERLALLPDVPTLAETLPGFVSDTWLAVAAPAGTPAPVVDKLSLALREVLLLPDIADAMRRVGALPVGSTPAESREFIRRETERWAEVIRAAAIKAD